MKIKFFLLPFCIVLILQSCKKKGNINPANTIVFSLANVLQSNMVIQRDKPFTIWGRAKAAGKVVVNVSWNSTVFYADADAGGNWSVSVPSSAANSNPQTIHAGVQGETPMTLSNILIGDVWICSGQSNMVMPVAPAPSFNGISNYPQEIADANYPQIRAFTVATNDQAAPATGVPDGSKWEVCSPATVGTISAVSYFFARKLTTELNIPVGIIISAVNNSVCEQWMNIAAFLSDPTIAPGYQLSSGHYYNAMISPLTNLSVKGFIWYQGESNEYDPVAYPQLNAALINGWRMAFKQGTLPFYYVQVAPYDSNQKGDDTDLDAAIFRDEQSLVKTMVAKSDMAVTMDVGDAVDHHPQNKKPVGERLALLALKNDYGENITANGPQYLSFTVNNYVVTVSFVNGTANGLTTSNNTPLKQYFFVAGPDQIFRQGIAVISGNKIIVTATSDTPLPIQSIRYAYTNFPITNIQNSSGLPMEPFSK